MVKKSAFNKSSRKNILGTMGRYLSLIIVSFLGAGILAGLLAIAPDMQETADTYFDDNDLSDVQIQSPLGFSQEDIQKIKDLSTVSEIQNSATFDAIGKVDDDNYTIRVQSIPDEQKNINKLTVFKGRLPKNSKEAVLVMPPSGVKNLKLNDTVTFTTADTKNIAKDTSFKIVGFVKSGLYPHNKQGTTSKGNGTIDFVLFASDKSFQKDLVTSLFIRFNNTTKLNSFSDEYEQTVKKDIKQIEVFSTTQAQKRYKLLSDELKKSEAELKDNLLMAKQQQNSENNAATLAALTSAKSSLQESKEKLVSIKKPLWYFETRSKNQGYAIYKSDAESMKSLATIFPVLFFLVAALVSLTTMTRMIEDERTLIGTFKALGYSNRKITGRYLNYSFSATLIGSTLGVYTGFRVLPGIIWIAYSPQYSIPQLNLSFHWNFALLSVVTMLIITSFVTIQTIRKTLKETPANLLIPKAPPVGKRIALEKITFIWKHLTFSQKVTQRNIFLDKKRMLMTIIGVIGSTALLVTGFGLKESASNFPKEQYQEITNYSLAASFDEAKQLPTDSQTILTNTTKVAQYLPIKDEVVQVASRHETTKEYYIDLIVSSQENKLQNFIAIKQAGTKIALKGKDVVVTKNIAARLKVVVGDQIKVKLLSGNDFENLTITGITDNYHLNYLYLNESTYREIFNEKPNVNKVLVNAAKGTSPKEVKRLLDSKRVFNNVELTTGKMNKLTNNLKSIDMVVVIMIVLASMLAIVVLYNVTNINIEERKREIATIKVLGFYDLETYSYVFRETIELAAIGILLGLGAGNFLFKEIVQSFGTEYYIFDTSLSSSTFIYSILFALGFTLLINLLMIPKIRKIDMLESLKSNE